MKLFFVIGVVFGLSLCGCDKGDSTQSPKDAPGVTVVLMGGTHVKPDGALAPAGLELLRTHSGDPILNVTFLRTNLSDAGLAQLAEFKNVRQVTAVGGRFTDKGVDQLKKAIPEVQVTK
jgi:hypothetical protein